MDVKTRSAPIMPLVVIHEGIGIADVLHVFGEVDIATAPELEAEIDAVDVPGPVVVDLLECKFIDTTGITVLIRGHKKFDSRFRLVVASASHIERVLKITRLPDIMRVESSIEDALAP